MKEEQLKKLLNDLKHENMERRNELEYGCLTEYDKEYYRAQFTNTRDIIKRLERVLYLN